MHHVEGDSQSVLWRVTGKTRGRTADGRKFTVGPTQRRCCCVVSVLIHRATASIHKEVDHCRHFQSQLFRNRCLNLLAWTFDLAKNGHQGAPLYLREHHPWLLAWNSRPWLGARRCSTRYIMTSLSTCIHSQRSHHLYRHNVLSTFTSGEIHTSRSTALAHRRQSWWSDTWQTLQTSSQVAPIHHKSPIIYLL